MVRRLAASMALVAFAVCIVVGLQAQNTFTTIISNALIALFTTFVIGLVVGTMAQKMLDENLAAPPAEKNLSNPEVESKANDR
jgi:hypothetical protein